MISFASFHSTGTIPELLHRKNCCEWYFRNSCPFSQWQMNVPVSVSYIFPLIFDLIVLSFGVKNKSASGTMSMMEYVFLSLCRINIPEHWRIRIEFNSNAAQLPEHCFRNRHYSNSLCAPYQYMPMVYIGVEHRTEWSEGVVEFVVRSADVSMCSVRVFLLSILSLKDE